MILVQHGEYLIWDEGGFEREFDPNYPRMETQSVGLRAGTDIVKR